MAPVLLPPATCLPYLLALGALFGWSAAHGLVRLAARARARAARRALGDRDAAGRIGPTGQLVTLRGTLQAGGRSCRRYEDGEEAAAATVRAVSSIDDEPGDEASARAETLLLLVPGAAVRLEGPVRVVVGSREAASGSRLARLPEAVLDRIGATDSVVEYRLRHRPTRARLCSVASGDRVVVAGVLERSDTAGEDDAPGYRDGAKRYRLVPEEGSTGLRIAFAGTPRVRADRARAVTGALAGFVVSLTVLFAARAGALAASAGESALDDPSTREPFYALSDEVERRIDDGDFEGASDAALQARLEERFAAEVHLLAGRPALAAAGVERYAAEWPTLATFTPCVLRALESFGGDGTAAAQDGLRRFAAEGSRRSDGCSLLLADQLDTEARLAVLEALPPGTRGDAIWLRIRFLLEIEAGKTPATEPFDDRRWPYATALLHRSSWLQRHDVLDYHIAGALRRAPQVHTDLRPFMEARAAYVLSALGDPAGARTFWDLAASHASRIDDELRALRVAIELRAGDRLAARRFAKGFSSDHDIATLLALLDAAAVDPAWVRDHSSPKALSELLSRSGADVAAELMRPGAFGDGELVFLVAPRMPGRELLLPWVKTGNPARDRHDSKGPPPPGDPIDRLMRLEERRQIAEAAGDPELAAALAAALLRGRTALLRRDIAVIGDILHEAGMGT